MVLTLYSLNASPPARAVKMVIEALDIRDVQYEDVNLLDGEHLTDKFVEVDLNKIIILYTFLFTFNSYCKKLQINCYKRIPFTVLDEPAAHIANIKGRRFHYLG